MLSPNILADSLPSKKLNESLFVFEELPSTNAYARELGKNPFPQGTVVLADSQSAGQGRLQRTWFSPPHTNIYGSIAFTFNSNNLQALGWIPLMAGLAIAEAIKQDTTITVDLKWPNDILIHERKVGGILCESFKQNPQTSCVVIGFGINVNQTESSFPEEIMHHATSLSIQAKYEINRHTLITAIIQNLEQGWDSLTSMGPQAIQLNYQARCITLGQPVQVQFPDGSQLEGTAISIGEHGQLQIRPFTSSQDSARIVEVHAGDIRHLRKSDSRSN